MTIEHPSLASGKTAPFLAAGTVVPALDRPFNVPLHGLRGVAALAVLWSHVIALLAFAPTVLAPFHYFSGGGAAVAFFFVLSGAVLSISLKRFTASPLAYVAYGIKRLFRLYPLLIVATAFGLAYAFLLHPLVRNAVFEPTFFGHYDEKPGPFLIVASFLGLIDKANPPTWTIFVEMIASAMLPFFVLFARNLGRAAILTAALLVVSFAAYQMPDSHVLLYRWPVFMVNFAAGILVLFVAYHWRETLARLSQSFRLVAVAALFLILMNGRELMAAGGYLYKGHADPVTNLFEMAVSFLIVLLMIDAPAMLAKSPLMRRLGNLSYGIYLLHFPTLFTITGLTVLAVGNDVLARNTGLFATWLLVATTLVTLLLSAITWTWLEAPMIALGRRIAASISKRG
ncbi:Acyltransferase family protein [Hartmannibacter diazotrophicus]|uniref:Acyltransferase family protein n=1 Tax=Hartmannibacter diazotrophicus TaxID=1482074 RepID=A0A2C9D3G3_9HYPH|nr:acyltransferase [Hartmannibacter diazotrophicus]SON54806.1 Acyltransferase family protein [Hartmannibacter diazotrophicus]